MLDKVLEISAAWAAEDQQVFLTKRKNSQHWQLELRFPKEFVFCSPAAEDYFEGRRHFTLSMRTPDRDEAEIRANRYIHAFRLAIYEWKRERHLPDYDCWGIDYAERRYADGLQIIDGMQAVVAGDRITYYGADGKPVRTARNVSSRVISAPDVTDRETAAAVLFFSPDAILPPKLQPERKSPDDTLIENYIKENALRPAIAADVRHTWDLYKATVNKPLAKATRKDAKDFAQKLAEGRARATVIKKVGWISAAIKYAIAEHDWSGPNPFASAVGKNVGGGEEERAPLSDEQMAVCWSHLGKLSKPDQLLWKLLAKTGMRLGEAMSISKDAKDRTGVRFVRVGTKTDSSLRDVPLPREIGLPQEIKGALFPGSAASASKRLNRFLRDTLPGAEGNVVHSLRHRAADVFRFQKDTDPYLRRRLLGHAAQDVHDTYGGSAPLDRLLRMIDSNPIDGTPLQ
jgi:integrase